MSPKEIQEFLSDSLRKLIEENRNKKHVFKKSQRLVNGEIVEYSVPTLITGYGAFYYLCDRPPTSSEPDCYTDIPDFKYMWMDETSTQWWMCLDNTEDAMVFGQVANQTNLPDMLAALGWSANTARSYSAVSSPDFATTYSPSETNDTEVVASFTHTSTLLGAALVNARVDGAVIAPSGISGIAATLKNTVTFTVPAGSSYDFVDVSGSNSFVAVKELPL